MMIASGSSGAASGDVAYSVAVNTGAARSGTITVHSAVGGATTVVTVTQSGSD
jgi:hypothetical protein